MVKPLQFFLSVLSFPGLRNFRFIFCIREAVSHLRPAFLALFALSKFCYATFERWGWYQAPDNSDRYSLWVYIMTLLKLCPSPPNKPKSLFVFSTHTESMSQETAVFRNQVPNLCTVTTQTASRSPYYFTCFKLFCIKKKSLYCFSGAGLPAGIHNRGYLPHTANAPGTGCQVSRPAQRAR